MTNWYELAKARMKELKISQEKLADRLGVTQGAVAHWMAGRREPSLEVIQKVLKQLDLPAMSMGNNRHACVHPASEAGPYRYPIIDWTRASKVTRATDLATITKQYEPADYLSQGPAFWLQISGDAMTALTGPSIPEGMLILVDTGAEMAPGKLVVAKLSDAAQPIFRKLVEEAGALYLKPLNADYKTVEAGDGCQFIGVAVRVMGRL